MALATDAGELRRSFAEPRGESLVHEQFPDHPNP